MSYAESMDIPTLLISNITPNPAIIPKIRHIMKMLDEEISKPNRTLKYRSLARREEILKEKKELTEARTKYASALSSVRKVSDILWARIISFNAEDQRELLTYMLVCYNWNFIARYFAQQWNNIDVNLCYDAQRGHIQIKDESWVERQFDRTRPLPMDVTIDYDFAGSLFYKSNRILKQLPNKKHWRSIKTGPSAMILLMKSISRDRDAFPKLEEVVLRSDKNVEEMNICGLSLRGLPCLTHLTIEVKDRIHKGYQGGIGALWYQLTQLTLDGVYSDASDYLDILAASLLLEKCSLRLSQSPYPPRRLPMPRGTRLSMPRLREFNIHGLECPEVFLSFLDAPRLESLTVGWENKRDPGDRPGQGIAKFIRASGCKVRTFDLCARDIFFSDVGKALRAMDSVEDVTLRISNSCSMPIIDRLLDDDDDSQDADGYAIRHTSRSTNPFFLPSLKSFAIHSAFFTLPLSWFVMFVQPKTLLLEDPVKDPSYEELDCVSFVYEDESLLVISAYPDLTKGMLSRYINAENPDVQISFD